MSDSVIEVHVQGPQGPQGPQGDAGAGSEEEIQALRGTGLPLPWNPETVYTKGQFATYLGSMYKATTMSTAGSVLASEWVLVDIVANEARLANLEGKSGWMDYNDAATTTTPIVVSADTWTTVTNDGLGAFTNKAYGPAGIANLLDVSTGAIDASGLDLGTTLLVRLDYTITPSTNNQLAKVRYSLGTGGGAYTLEKTLPRLDTGSGKPYRNALSLDMIYLGDSNTRDNPIFIQVNTSGNSVLTNAGVVVQVI